MLSLGDLNNDTAADLACAKLELLEFDEIEVLPVEIFFQSDEHIFPPEESLSLKYHDTADLGGNEQQIIENLSKLPQEPPAIDVGDLNNDGMDDVVCVYNSTGAIEIFYQELDSDHDGYPDSWDDFPYNSLEWLDTDSDGVGNNADLDDDNDGYNDTIEIDEGTDPLDPNSKPLDHDSDYIVDSQDSDDDNDGYNDVVETALGTNPKDNTSYPLDTDSDGIPDELDDDDDNDDHVDSEDDYPLDSTRWKKSEDTPSQSIFWIILLVVAIFCILLFIILLKKRNKKSDKK
jgi:hypothetical protein